MIRLTVEIVCDNCRVPFPGGHVSDGSRVDSRGVRKLARAVGWKCRAWDSTNRMIDCCPKCIPKRTWERPPFRKT